MPRNVEALAKIFSHLNTSKAQSRINETRFKLKFHDNNMP